MSDEDDMDHVTRKELREELAPLHAAIADVRDRFATKHDLDNLRTATREDLENAIAPMATKADLAALDERFTSFREEIDQSLARHFAAAVEHFRALFGVLDDKYRDLPARVTKLENDDAATRLARIEQHLFVPRPPATPSRRAPKKRKPRAA